MLEHLVYLKAAANYAIIKGFRKIFLYGASYPICTGVNYRGRVAHNYSAKLAFKWLAMIESNYRENIISVP